MSQTTGSGTGTSAPPRTAPPGAEAGPVSAAQDARQAETIARLQQPISRPERAPSPGWQAWAYFGATIMVLMGMFWVVFGLMALIDQQYFSLRPSSLLVFQSYAAWGWVHIIGGVIALVVGIGILLMGAALWARIAGMVVAGISAVANLAFLEASPFWGIIVIAMDVLVIYALAMHGSELDYRE